MHAKYFDIKREISLIKLFFFFLYIYLDILCLRFITTLSKLITFNTIYLIFDVAKESSSN